MTSVKVKKTLTLDPDILAALGDSDGAALSATVNAILRAEVQRRQSRAALGQLVDRLDAEFGQPDPALVAHYEQLLS